MLSNQLTSRHQYFTTQFVVLILISLVGSGGMLRGFGPAANSGLALSNVNHFAPHSANHESHTPEETNEHNSSEELPDFLRRTMARQVRLALRSSLWANRFCRVAVAEKGRKPIVKSKRFVEFPCHRDRLNGFGGHLLI